MQTQSQKRWKNTEEVIFLARGHWGTILPILCGSTLADALKVVGRHVTCPFHGGKADFRLARDFEVDGKAHCSCGGFDGLDLVMRSNAWDFPTAVARVEEIVGGRYANDLPPPVIRRTPDPVKQAKDDQRIKETMRRWWNQTIPLDHPDARVARQYLKNRKLGSVLLPLEDLGFHPRLEYFDDARKVIGRFPAIIAIVRMPDGRVSTAHRTYLSMDGHKAFNGEDARKQYRSPSTNPLKGSAIRLDKNVGKVLNLAEGLETALAARAITGGQPTWSTLNKELLKSVVVPDTVKLVTIWADLDRSEAGECAARVLMQRLRDTGVKCVVMLPPGNIPAGKKGVDWNDVVSNLGLESARNLPLVQQWRGGMTRFI